MRSEYLFFAVFVGLLTIISVSAYNTYNPPVFGHSANEIEVASNTAIGPVYSNSLHYVSDYQNALSDDSGTILNGSSYGGFMIPAGAKEVFLKLQFNHSSAASTSVEVKFKYPGQTTWKTYRLDADGASKRGKKYFWIPLNFQGKLDWQIDHLSDSSDITTVLLIKGYR